MSSWYRSLYGFQDLWLVPVYWDNMVKTPVLSSFLRQYWRSSELTVECLLFFFNKFIWNLIWPCSLVIFQLFYLIYQFFHRDSLTQFSVDIHLFFFGKIKLIFPGSSRYKFIKYCSHLCPSILSKTVFFFFIQFFKSFTENFTPI